MKLPCAVTRDLLPLYAENMVEQETKVLIEEHLNECDDCKKKLSEMNVPAENPIDTAKPLQNLKKQLRKKRLYAAALAALIVFVGVYTYFFRTMAVQLLPWQDGLIEIIGVKTYQPEDVVVDERDTETSESVTPSPTTAPYTAKHPDEGLVLKVNSIVNGFEEHVVVDDDGTDTLFIQALSTNQHSDHLAQSYYEYTIYPVPDRLIYGLQQPQTLLWGTPMNGGVEILPRLALAYYLIIALVAAGVCGLMWGVLRKWKNSWIVRQLFFAPVSYILSHLLLKGMKTTSFFMERDLLSILLVAIAIYALFTIVWQMILARRKEALNTKLLQGSSPAGVFLSVLIDIGILVKSRDKALQKIPDQDYS